MAEATTVAPAPNTQPAVSGIAAVALAFFIPGGGYFLLRRPVRGLLVAAAVVIMFLAGVMMRGAFFQPQGGDLLNIIIYCGGFLAHVCTGALYFITVALGYSQPDIAGHVHDYGAKMLVGAGLLNILAMVDVWEIATGQKD